MQKGDIRMNSKITESIIYIGANDHDIDLFEGQYIVPNGMAYNSYAIIDNKIAIMDTIDKSKTQEWLQFCSIISVVRNPHRVRMKNQQLM